MVLARSCSHMRSISARARAGSLSATSTSIYLPWRTPSTAPKPSACSAPSMALPCGSSTPGFSVMVIRAFMLRFSPCSLSRLHQHGTAARPRRTFHVQAKPARHLLVGLDQATHVAAEAILVQLVLSLDVPQPAAVGRDLVGEDDAHVLAFPQTAELDLEVHQPDADAEEQT